MESAESTKRLQYRNIGTVAVIAAVLLMSVLMSIQLLKNITMDSTDNQIRMELNIHKEKVSQGIYEPCVYPYIVFDLSGYVLYKQDDFSSYHMTKVNVQEMLTKDESFVREHKSVEKHIFVLEKNQTVNGFVVYLVAQKAYNADLYAKQLHALWPIGCGLLISMLIIIYHTWYLNHRVLKPVKKISASAQAMIQGNYDLEVLRVYEDALKKNEIGDLTYSFELMRDELKAKQIKEEALKKSQQELISCISHDLKTPIATIQAYSEGLRDGIARTTEARNEYVGIIIEKTKLLTTMIQELLEYSNTQLNQLDIKRSEIYLYQYIEPVLKELQIYVNHQNVDFSYDISAANQIVVIDEKRITEVLYNLAENSMKYRNEADPWIHVNVYRKDGQICISVKDNGIGINAADIPYVFDKFYRAEKSRSSSIPGSGLGLSICKYIIEAHHGDISCRSRNHGGCEFVFSLGSDRA